MKSNQESIPLLVIVGPTATGKTEVAIRVARRIDGEIVSADSMLVYRKMNIGTAKPGEYERKEIPHHMIDIVDPKEEYTVALYQREARAVIEDIWKRGKVPLLVGGTGLYVRSVIDDYHFGGAGIDSEFRENMLRVVERFGPQELHKRLAQVDPGAASRLHPNDVKRVIRALEVYRATGQPISAVPAGPGAYPVYSVAMFGLTMSRDNLYRRIEQRVDRMIENGLVKEVQELLTEGCRPGMTSMQGLGYKEIALYLSGELSFDEAVRLIKRNTRRFAKRQLTWFRRDRRIVWLNLEGYRDLDEVAEEIIRLSEGVLRGVSKK